MRKDKRDRQKRKQLIYGLWQDFNDPATTPDARVRISKAVARLELGDGQVSMADKAEAKDSGAGKLPKAWLVPDAQDLRWAVIYAVERLAGLAVPHPTALDAWIASLSAEEQAGLRASAAKLVDADTKPRPATPPADAERLASTIPQPTPPVFTAADAFRHWHGGSPDPQPFYSVSDFNSEVTALPDAKR